MSNELSTKQSLRLALSKKGNLSFLIRKHQKPIYDECWKLINNELNAKSYLINCSRQFGKSFVLLTIAVEFCIRNPGSQIRFAIPVAKNYTNMYQASINVIQANVDQCLGMLHIDSKKLIEFSNKSVITFAGTDAGNAESLRGSASHLNIIDEAAFVDDLEYLYTSVLLPQLITTKGKTIFCSTPPSDLDNYYVELYHRHLDDNLVSTYTVDDNLHMDEEQKQTYIKEYGGEDKVAYRREFLCEFLVDTEMTVIPEWSKDFEQDWPRDEYFTFYHKIEAMDLGVTDLTACLFGYYDYSNAKLIVEAEFTLNGADVTTGNVVKYLEEKERFLNYKDVKLRVSDNNSQHLNNTLLDEYDINFIPTTKTDLDAMVNNVRMMVSQGKIIVNPRCEHLLGCLNFGRWEKKKRGEMFAKSKKLFHLDGLAALVYMVRNLNYVLDNPIPLLHNVNSQKQFIPKSLVKKNESNLEALFPALYKKKQKRFQ